MAIVGVALGIALADNAQAFELAQFLAVHALLVLAVATVLAIFHEGGHTIVGILAGEHIIAVYIGQGPTIASTKVAGVRLELRGTIVGGATIAVPSGSRAGRVAMLLAGVAMEALIVAIAFFSSPAAGMPSTVRWMIIGVGLLDIVVNLWPHETDAGPLGTLPTDGAQLLRIARGEEMSRPLVSAAEVDASLRFGQAVEENKIDHARALAAAEVSAHPDRFDAQFRYGLALLLSRDYAEAAHVLYPLVHCDEPALDEWGRGLVLNNFAYAAVMTFDASWIELADAPSAEALRLHPTTPSVAGTRGNVLIMTGRVDDGMQLLRQASIAMQEDTAAVAEMAGMLAVGAGASGDRPLSKSYYDAMITADPDAGGRSAIESILGRYGVLPGPAFHPDSRVPVSAEGTTG